MKLEFTKDIPTEEGYYYWTNFGEHTPVILKVKRDHATGKLYAENGEFLFQVEAFTLTEEQKDPETLIDGYYLGEELWCKIPDLYLPGGKKKVEPSCY